MMNVPVEKVLNLSLNVNELNVVFAALQDAAIPHRVVDPLLKKLLEQANAQMPPATAEPKE